MLSEVKVVQRMVNKKRWKKVKQLQAGNPEEILRESREQKGLSENCKSRFVSML